MMSAIEENLALVQKNYPQLSELSLQKEIATLGKRMDFEAGTLLQDYGSYVKMVPLIVKGSIKVLREGEEGNELLLYYLKAGETCSMSFSCCMMNKKSDIRTLTEEETCLIAIPIQYVDEWMVKYKTWQNFVMRSYDERMRELIKTVDRIAFHDLDKRLLNYLRERANVTNANTIHTTHLEIAQDLNASREGISRLLKKLENQGVVRLARNKVEMVGF